MVFIFTTAKRAIREVEYAFCPTPYGEVLAAWCKGWLCFATFTPYLTREKVLEELQGRFPKANLKPTHRSLDLKEKSQRVLLVGSKFRLDVWRALLQIQHGTTATYKELALTAGHPTAIRAVATSVGCNPISVIVPCHRIVPTSGGTGRYHSGAEIKRLILQDEGLA